MSRFDFITTDLAGLIVVQRKAVEDPRGFLSRFYCAEEFNKAGMCKSIAQINHTLTNTKGAVRGLHFQYPPHAETKLVSCLQGEIFDVAVDLRRDSPTFLHWHAEILTAKNRKSLLIPEGFAHGFLVTSESAEFIYKTTDYWYPEDEHSLHWNDPEIGIHWPLDIQPIISAKDESASALELIETFE